MSSSTLLPHFGQYINFILSIHLLENNYLKHALPVEAEKKSYMYNEQFYYLRENLLAEKPAEQSPAFIRQESILNAISVGSVFILLGLVYVLALPTSLWDLLIRFLGGFAVRQFPGTGISVPVPLNPGAYLALFSAVFRFCLGIGLLQILVLALRLLWKSPVRRTAETAGNLVFWLGVSFAVAGLLMSITPAMSIATATSMWFAFWGAFILITGFSLLARAAVILLKK